MSNSKDDGQLTLAQEWESWKTPPPPPREIAPVPKVGDKAPVNPNLELPKNKPTLIVFLRHCGCPFAEKVFRQLTALSSTHGSSLVHLVAVSHSSAEATERWVVQVGGNWDVGVVVDEERELYAQWGLGVGSAWHVLGPRALYGALRLGRGEGIWNRPTESGSRWQTSGAFAVDSSGTVRWAHVATSADDLPDLTRGLQSVGIRAKRGRASSAAPVVQSSGFL